MLNPIDGFIKYMSWPDVNFQSVLISCSDYIYCIEKLLKLLILCGCLPEVEVWAT